MILFCEDCGSKNSIGPYQVTGDKAVFRCSSCNYLNTIILGTPEKNETIAPSSANSTKALFTERLLETPGVFGFFLYHAENGIIQNAMPDVLLPEDLKMIGEILNNTYKQCYEQFDDIDRQVLVIKGKNLVMEKIDEKTAFIMACNMFPLTANIETLIDDAVQINWSEL